MRIDANVLRAVNNYNSAVKSIGGTIEQLASGSRLYRSATDTASMVVNARLRAQLNGLQQAARNAQEGINVLNVADAALGEIYSSLLRVHELAIGAANTGVADADARAAYDAEARDLIDAANRVASTASYATLRLLDGSYSAQSFMIDDNGASVLTVSIADSRASALGVAGVDLTADAQGATSVVSGAIDTVTSRRSQLGAIVSRLEATIATLQNTVENLMQASSRMADVDVAQAGAKLQRDKVAAVNGAKALDRAMAASVQVLRVIR